MKHGKNPTKAQKRIIAYYKLDHADWMVSKATDKQLCLVHRYTEDTLDRHGTHRGAEESKGD